MGSRLRQHTAGIGNDVRRSSVTEITVSMSIIMGSYHYTSITQKKHTATTRLFSPQYGGR